MSDELNVFGPPKQSRAELVARSMAARLRDHIDSMQWGRDAHGRWQAAFVLLIDAHGEQVVTDRLNAYIASGIERPKVHNGDDFRRNWVWIGDAIKQHQQTTAPAEVSPVVKSIITQLESLTWPETARVQLPAVVHHSVNNYTAFVKRFRTVALPDKTLDALRNHLMSGFGGAEDYVTQWFRDVWKKMYGWDEWSGTLTSWVWSPDHQWVIDTMQHTANQWGASYAEWEKIKGVILTKGD